MERCRAGRHRERQTPGFQASVARLREENDRLRRDNRRLEDERRQVLGQIDAVLRDIAKLDLGAPS